MTISPLHDSQPVTSPAAPIRAAAAPDRSSPRVTNASAQDTAAVTVDTIPASPPVDVLAEMATASSAPDRLAAAGRALHFSLGEPGAGVSVQVTDLHGTVLGTVTPSTALTVAAGADLD